MRSSPAARRSQTLLLCAALLPALAFACSTPTERTPSAFEGDGDGNSSGGGEDNASSSGAPTQQSSGGGALSSGGDDGTSSGEPAVCATSASVVERQPVYLDILLDDSGSMNGAILQNNQLVYPARLMSNDPRDPGRMRGKRWIAVREALIAYFEAQGAIASPRLGVGLDLFRVGTLGQSGYLAPIGIAKLDSAHAARLTDMIDPPFVPIHGTFMLEALDRSLERFANFSVPGNLAPGGRKAILLITDGVPSNVSHKGEVVRKIAAVAAAASDPIVTAVIGVGEPDADIEDFDPNFLSKAAYAGGLAPEGCIADWRANSPGAHCHYQITPRDNQDYAALQADLSATIDAISARLVSCELPLDVTDEVDPATTNVVYTPEGGAPEQLTADNENGYSLDDPENPSKVILHGQSCEKLKQGGEVQVVLGCPAGQSVIN